METTVYNAKGQESGKINLPDIFETKVSPALIHEVTVAYLANQRSGTHSTKTRGEVSGGGNKPWKQKGTGNARSGSNRSPLWRKGGIIFGPRPHGYHQNISQQKKQQALGAALTLKAKENNILVVDGLSIDEPKTKKMMALLKNFKIDGGSVLAVIDKIDNNIKIASRNIPWLLITESRNLTAYHVLQSKKTIFTTAAIQQLKGSK